MNEYNVAQLLKKNAQSMPDKKAVIYPAGKKNNKIIYNSKTYKELDDISDCYATGFENQGIKKGTKTILMVKPGLDLITVSFALFKIGAIPIVVDPGMGIKRMLHCYKSVGAEAFIGIPVAHIIRVFFRSQFKSINVRITAGKKLFWRGSMLKNLLKGDNKSYEPAVLKDDELAVINFTTGSTGPAKGVEYTHGMFTAMAKILPGFFNFKKGEVDCAILPLFALIDAALGITAVIPDMDPTKPAHVEPLNIIDPIIEFKVTTMFASPALLNRVGRYGKKHKIKLPTLKRIITGGAPVSPSIIELFYSLLEDDAEFHTTYGATEGLPISSIECKEILSETRHLSDQGHGTCVGCAVNGIELKIIKTSDQPIEALNDHIICKKNEIGEILITGDHISKKYYNNPEENNLAKIFFDNRIWHRMGDLAYLDDKNRIWFCGRKKHRIELSDKTLYSVPCEALFNTHPKVFRSALIQIEKDGKTLPAICIELEDQYKNCDIKSLEKELIDLAKHHDSTKDITTIFFPDFFPVDIRHNSKIFREKLALWAENEIKQQI